VSDDGLFRKLFIDAINGVDPEADENHDGFVSGTELGRYLTYKVTSYKRTDQTPRYGKMREYGLDRGEFIFRTASPKVVAESGAGRSTHPDDTAAVPSIPFATRGAALPVYFLTDRERSNDDSRVGFSNKRTKTLTLGKALVRVAATEGADSSWRASLDGMSVLEQDEFVSGFPSELARVDKFRNQALIFVHGYNISFDNAFYRTAQIANDIGFDGPSIVYSWPSAESVATYARDRESAAVASANFAKFVEWLALRTPLERIHIIAHGMGGGVLLEALRKLQHASAYVKARIGDLIFVAPDVDRDLFAFTVSNAKGIGRSVTLYATSNDRSLRIASLLGSIRRAGDVGTEGPFVMPGVDTIDISALETELFQLQHSGRVTGNTVLSDVSLLLQGVRPPDKRLPNLQPVTTPSGTYWKWQR
jgi:esterase/lipase superfamily enzyme